MDEAQGKSDSHRRLVGPLADRALITGASRGLGRGIAVALAARGYQVTGTGRDADGLEATAALCDGLPGSFSARVLDVREGEAVAALLGELDELDVCIANAGVAWFKPFVETGEAELRELLEVNVVGAFAVLRAAAQMMLDRGTGRLMAIASDASYIGIAEMAGYTASKHALYGLTRSLALELAGTGVGVTTVFPGAIGTEILGKASLEGGMEVEEVAETIAALASVGASIGACELHLQPHQ